MKKFFTIHKGDVGSEAFRDEYVKQVETERNEACAALREAMDCMLAGHGWAQHLERWCRIANNSGHLRTTAGRT